MYIIYIYNIDTYVHTCIYNYAWNKQINFIEMHVCTQRYRLNIKFYVAPYMIHVYRSLWQVHGFNEGSAFTSQIDVCNIENWIKFSFMDIYDMDWYGNRSRIIKILFFTSVYIYICVFSMIYGNNPSHWLIFFRGVEPPTRYIYIYYIYTL